MDKLFLLCAAKGVVHFVHVHRWYILLRQWLEAPVLVKVGLCVALQGIGGQKGAQLCVPLLQRCVLLAGAQTPPNKSLKFYHLLFQVSGRGSEGARSANVALAGPAGLPGRGWAAGLRRAGGPDQPVLPGSGGELLGIRVGAEGQVCGHGT